MDPKKEIRKLRSVKTEMLYDEEAGEVQFVTTVKVGMDFVYSDVIWSALKSLKAIAKD